MSTSRMNAKFRLAVSAILATIAGIVLFCAQLGGVALLGAWLNVGAGSVWTASALVTLTRPVLSMRLGLVAALLSLAGAVCAAYLLVSDQAPHGAGPQTLHYELVRASTPGPPTLVCTPTAPTPVALAKSHRQPAAKHSRNSRHRRHHQTGHSLEGIEIGRRLVINVRP